MRAANRSYRTSAAAGSRWPNDRISESSGRFSFDRTRSTVLGRSTHGNRARLCWTVVGCALFDVGPDVLEDEGREVLVPPDHEVPLVEVVLSGNPPPGDEGERGRPAIDEGVRLLVLRRRLSCGQPPVPAPLAHAFQVHLDALPGAGQAGPRQERVGSPTPVGEDLPGGEFVPHRHGPLVEPVHPELAVVGLAKRFELDRRVAPHDLGCGSLLGGQVSHDVAVAPPSADAVPVPGVGPRVLDGTAQPLSLGLRDAQQLGAVQAHPALLVVNRRPAGAAADCTLGPMRVLIAPDKFRGTLTAVQAAHAVASGWRRARPGDTVVEVPMADGGEGTLDVMLEALGGARHRARVHGPLDDPVDAEYGIVSGPSGVTAVMEMARASGLALIGGAGLAQALGVRLLSSAGGEIGPGGEALLGLERIDVSGLDPAVRRTRFLVVCDVDNPLTGPRGASVVFGPQKGATSDDVLLLDRALGHLAAVIFRDLGLDVRDLAGGGAAGGLGAGMVAFLGAHLRPGVELVMDVVDLVGRLAAADLVVTGEGSLDQQSLHGKVPDGVIGAARASGVRAIVLCGRAEIRPTDVPVFDLVGRFGEERAMTDARAALEDLAEEVAAGLPSLSSSQ